MFTRPKRLITHHANFMKKRHLWGYWIQMEPAFFEQVINTFDGLHVFLQNLLINQLLIWDKLKQNKAVLWIINIFAKIVQPMSIHSRKNLSCSCLSWKCKSYSMFILRKLFDGYYDEFYTDNFFYMFTVFDKFVLYKKYIF